MNGYGIKETTTTTGTGTLTLSAVSGFARFSSLTVGTLVQYSLIDSGGLPMEAGYGTIGAGNTLTRDRVTQTISGGTYNDLTPSALSLTGTTTVICTGLASSPILAAPNVSTTNTFSGNAPQRVVMDDRINFAAGSSTGLTVVADRLYLVPFRLGVDVIATGVAMRVGTGAAGKSMRAGLYEVDANGAPSKLLGETASTSCATTGVNWSASFTGGNKKLTAGMYVTAFVSDGTPAIATLTNQVFFNSFGLPNAANLITPTGYAYGSHTYGAMPEPSPSALSAGASAYPAIGLTIV